MDAFEDMKKAKCHLKHFQRFWKKKTKKAWSPEALDLLLDISDDVLTHPQPPWTHLKISWKSKFSTSMSVYDDRLRSSSKTIGYDHSMIIVYDHRLWSSSMIIVYHHRLWSSSMIIVYHHRLWSSSKTIVYHHPLWSSSIIIMHDHRLWSSSMVIMHHHHTWLQLGAWGTGAWETWAWETILYIIGFHLPF